MSHVAPLPLQNLRPHAAHSGETGHPAFGENTTQAAAEAPEVATLRGMVDWVNQRADPWQNPHPTHRGALPMFAMAYPRDTSVPSDREARNYASYGRQEALRHQDITAANQRLWHEAAAAGSDYQPLALPRPRSWLGRLLIADHDDQRSRQQAWAQAQIPISPGRRPADALRAATTEMAITQQPRRGRGRQKAPLAHEPVDPFVLSAEAEAALDGKGIEGRKSRRLRRAAGRAGALIGMITIGFPAAQLVIERLSA